MNKQQEWKAQRDKTAFLALEDGSIFRGYSVGAAVDGVGEVVFNTGMSGYEEIISDPSYAGQFVTMTYTEIGNIGMNAVDMESRKLFLNGFLMHAMNESSNWRADASLKSTLVAHKIPALAGLDTRALTCKLRDTGTLKGCLSVEGKLSEAEAVAKAKAWEGLDGQDYASRVSCDKPYVWDPEGTMTASWGFSPTLPPADLNVVAYDFGIKWNILRNLRQCGMKVTVVPAKTPAADVLAMTPDGVFLSNGPADPAAVGYAADAIRALLGKVPLMGICLGHQLLGIALGGKTYRLKFGHHGINHPVMNLATRAVEVTSQNHNFAIDPATLGEDVEVTHLNLNDQTVEGLRSRCVPAFSVQYHPEAGPGPHDPFYLFNQFRDLMKKA
ncbi:MAG TPA: carbamoyl phosphate synthase small subunit [Verrucomicrobia bacterium]|nr:carbamoyl phosphate synthase small subunit [Verrucomicrobiota bacterium]